MPETSPHEADQRPCGANCQRARKGASRCRQVLDGLDIPEPFELSAFLAYVAELRGRRIAVLPFTARHGLCGAWIHARHADYIYHDEYTTDLHRTHIVMHEIAHMLLGHEGTDSISWEFRRQLAPCLGPGLMTMMLGRGGAYASPQEREAETLASMILGRASRVDSPASSARRQVHGDQAEASGSWRLPVGECHRTWSQSRSYRQLQPLWQALQAAVPHVALPYEAGADQCRLAFRTYRRIIEIRDGELALRAYRDPDAIADAESRARSAGLHQEELNATVEAAAIATAISAKTAGRAPTDSETIPPSIVDPGRDLAHEIEWLTRVSQIFARSPIIRPLHIAPSPIVVPGRASRSLR